MRATMSLGTRAIPTTRLLLQPHPTRPSLALRHAPSLAPRLPQPRQTLLAKTQQRPQGSVAGPGTQQQQQQQPRSPRLLPRALWFLTKWLLLTGGAFLAGGYLAVLYLPNRDAITALLAQKLPTPAETLTAFHTDDAALASINARIVDSALAKKLRAVPGLREWRPHLRIPDAIRPTNMTGGVLAGAGRIAVPPLVFNAADGSASTVIFYLGEQLCGHPGIIHGGLLATMLDEGLARCCFDALPNKMAVTANLQVDYRKPAVANRFYVLRAETQAVQGRKAWVKGWIEEMGDEDLTGVKGDKQPVKVCEASALFVEPRNAHLMKRLYSQDA